MTKITLDHVGLVSPDLARSYEDYDRLGFTLTQKSSHRGKLSPDGDEELWGSGNHCAMFKKGYLELLGVTDPDRPHESVQSYIDKFHGMQLIALGCSDAAGLFDARRALDEADVLCAPVELGRDVPQGLTADQTEPAIFRIVHLVEDSFPEAELFFIEQATPEVLWQEDLLEHPNGVLGLAGASLCSEDPEISSARFERVTGNPASPAGNGFRFELERGFVEVVPAAQITTEYPGAILPAIPSVAVASFEVADAKATETFFRDRDMTVHRSPKGLWISPERAGGVILEFVQA